MVSLQRIKVKNIKCVFMTFFTPRGSVRADASPCMVLTYGDTAVTSRDIKLMARSKWDPRSSGILRSVYREVGCPETSVSNHQSTLRNSEDHILPDTSQIIYLVTQFQLPDI